MEKHLFNAIYPRCQMCGVRKEDVHPEQILTDENEFSDSADNCVINDLAKLCETACPNP